MGANSYIAAHCNAAKQDINISRHQCLVQSAVLVVQVSERVAVRVQRRRAADAAKQALLEAEAREQEQFERIKQEFGVDTATVRSGRLLL